MIKRTTGTKRRRKRVSNEDLLKYEEQIIRRRYAVLYAVGIVLFTLICIAVYVLWNTDSIGWALLTAILVVPLFIVVMRIHERIEDGEINVYLKDDVDRYKDYAVGKGTDYYTLKKKVDAAIKNWEKAYVAAYGDIPDVHFEHYDADFDIMTFKKSRPSKDKQVIEKEKKLRGVRDRLCKQALLQMQECLDDDGIEALRNNDTDEIMRLYGVLYYKD